MTVTLTGIWLLITIIVTIASAVGLILSRRAKDLSKLAHEHTEELEGLADTRKEIIDQLHDDLANMRKEHTAEIEQLRREVAELRGAYDALQKFKVDEIADAVVAKLIGEDAL